MGSFRKRRGLITAALAMAMVAGCTSSKGFGVGSSGSGGSTPASGGSTSSSSPSTAPGPPGTPGALPAQPVAAWHACTGGDGPAGSECATVPVPLDYTNPAGRKIGIAMARHAATGTKTGSLLFDPGGPGASGIDGFDNFVQIFSPSILQHFDIIGFDPRGVGRSSPVRCQSGPQLDEFIHVDPGPTTDAGFAALVNASRTFVQGCQAMSGALLPFVGTVSAARDMDQIRQALGQAKLNYFGFSYGTLLGATYAEEYPTNIRVMVLDGAVNPALDPITTNIVQAAGFDKELSAFFAWCAAAGTGCAWQPTGKLQTAFDALMAGIAAHPLAAGARTLGPGEAFFGVAYGLYDQQLWRPLADALEQAARGDGSGLLDQSDAYTQRNADGTYSNSVEANNAINCVDAPWPTDPKVLQSSAPLAKSKAPEFGVPDLYGGVTCTLWPVKPTSQPHRIQAAGSPPIVVVGSTGDPATPYVDAQALAGQLQHGVLITRVGDGHTGYRSSACIRAAVDAFLATTTPPAAGLSCPTP